MPARLVTAVAIYGPKTVALRELLGSVQAICAERLGTGFRPYTLDQIHATLIRLDGLTDPRTGLVVNQRHLELTGERRAMDLARALEILTACLTPPLRIRIGGYDPAGAARFTSRGQHPHERSFTAQAGALVLVGWPVATAEHGPSHRPLDDLRRNMAKAGIAHLYHRSPGEVDNDFHLVVGHYDGVAPGQAQAAISAVRGYLAGHPEWVDVGAGQVSIVASDSPTLVPARFARRLPVDPADLDRLYC